MWEFLVFLFWVWVVMLVGAAIYEVCGFFNRHRRVLAVLVAAPVLVGVVMWTVGKPRAEGASTSTTQVCDYRGDLRNPSCRMASEVPKALHDRLEADGNCVLTGDKDGPDGCVILKQDVDHYEKATQPAEAGQ